jgi:predicted nuclease of predicted toxin-antitoxin system
MDAPKKRSRKRSATKAESPPEPTTFFVDRSLGRALGRTLRDAGWTVELHDDHFAEDTLDETWLLEVGAKGWVVLTKDKAIRRRPVERAAIIAARVRMFTLSGGNMTGQEMAEVYLANQSRITRFLNKNPPPFIATVYRDAPIALCRMPEDDPKGAV